MLGCSPSLQATASGNHENARNHSQKSIILKIDTNCQITPLSLHHQSKVKRVMTTFYYNKKNYNFENAQIASLEDIMSSIVSTFDSSHTYELVCDEYASRYLAVEDSFNYVVMCRIRSKSGSEVVEYLVGCCDEPLS